MKRFVLSILLCLFLITGCTVTENTPTRRVEEFMGRYQNLDNEVLTQLDKIVSSDNTLTDNARKDYTALMKKQYQNLSYKITDEKIEDDTASVVVEIEVYDYISSVNKSEDYYNNHKEEFDDKNKYIDYKIKEMQKVSDRKQYEIVFTLRKEDNRWVMDNISDTDREKIHGLFNK